MDAAMPPQPQVVQPGAKAWAPGTSPNKGRSPIFVILLLSLIPVMFGCALAIRYATRGPRVVRTEAAPTTVAPTTAAVAITTTPLLWPSATSSESHDTEPHVTGPFKETTATKATVPETSVTASDVTDTSTVEGITVPETSDTATYVTDTTTVEGITLPETSDTSSDVTQTTTVEVITVPETSDTATHVTDTTTVEGITVPETSDTSSDVTETTTVEEITVPETSDTAKAVTDTTTIKAATVERSIIDLTKPYAPRRGSEVYPEDHLPKDVTPEGYELTIALNGTRLADDKMQVTGKAVVSYKVVQATSKLVLKASSTTIKHVKLALLEARPADGKAKGLNITTLSFSRQFMIARLEKPLTKNSLYTLVVEYEYDKAAQGGPIKLAARLPNMVLAKGQAHSLFPCSEEQGWNVPINLTLKTPNGLVAVSNAPLDGDPTEDGGLTVHKFKPTKAMPPDMLAWIVFPNTRKHTPAVPNKLNTYMKKENANLTAAAKKAFEFLEKFFQKTGGEHIPKIDMVFDEHAESQESLGIIVLAETLNEEQSCAKIARQWTHKLMSQPNDPTWLGSAGVAYLCLLAVTEESALPAKILEQVKHCTEATPNNDIRDLLAFRMVHIILGDAATQTAIQAYVTAHLFNDTTSEKEMAAFSPITAENIDHWRKETFKTKKLKRLLGATKKITWEEPTTDATPFAKNATTGAVNARAPTAVAVAWLNKTHASFEVTAEDTQPLYVNPSVMACYRIHLDSEWWKLIGKDMEKTPPDAINAWYLLGEAAKQFATIKREADFSGFVWMWAALKSGDTDLWDEHVKKFVEAERVVYSLLDTERAETNFTARIKAVIAARVKAITAKEITAANAKKAPVLLANLACEIGMKECSELVPVAVSAKALDKDFDSAPLAQEAVACSFGSAVTNETEFDAKMPLATGHKPPWPVRLAFCGCIPIPSESDKLTDKVNAQYRRALRKHWTVDEAAPIRVPHGLRKLALDTLTSTTKEPHVYQQYLKSAAALKLVRSTDELKKIREAASKRGISDADLKEVQDSVVQVNASLLEWINYSPPTP
ncbi:uncharacterized protein [Dermacentor albipictus]|uniref:uncharacterized protein isoform X2 n=1 Tax=Dermacentor albipictus TaxID=60249 RepID=UPI0031FD7292